LHLGYVFVSVVLFVSVHACNSVDDIVLVGLTVVQVAGEDLGSNVPPGCVVLRDHFSGYPMDTIPYTFMCLVVALTEWFHLLSPRAGLSNRVRSYTFEFSGSPAVRLTDLQFSLVTIYPIYMCACVILTFFAGTHLALGPIALRAHRSYGLSYVHSPKRYT